MHAFQQQILSLPGLPIPPRRHRMRLSRTRFAKHSLLAVAYGLSPPKHSLKPRLDFAMMVRAALPDTICSRRSVIRLARHAGKTTLFATFPPRCACAFTPCPGFGTLLDGTSFSPVCTPVRVGSFGGCLCPGHPNAAAHCPPQAVDKVCLSTPPTTGPDGFAQPELPIPALRLIVAAHSEQKTMLCQIVFFFLAPCLSCFHRVGAHSLSAVGQRLSVPIPGPHGNPNRRSGEGCLELDQTRKGYVNSPPVTGCPHIGV